MSLFVCLHAPASVVSRRGGAQPANVAATAPPTDFQEKPPAAETILMCGWRRDTDNLVELLDHLVRTTVVLAAWQRD